jgi:hypothetical protein
MANEGEMGIPVICSYRAKLGREDEARRLLAQHVPTLRKHGLVTERAVIQGEGADRSLVEMFEWASEEKSRMAPTIAEVAELWKSMSETMDFVPLSALSEAQKSFAHFKPL